MIYPLISIRQILGKIIFWCLCKTKFQRRIRLVWIPENFGVIVSLKKLCWLRSIMLTILWKFSNIGAWLMGTHNVLDCIISSVSILFEQIEFKEKLKYDLLG